MGVPDPQGTDSGPRAPLRRGDEPVGGAKIFFYHIVLLEYDLDQCCGSAVLSADRCPLRISTSCRSVPFRRRSVAATVSHVAVLSWSNGIVGVDAVTAEVLEPTPLSRPAGGAHGMLRLLPYGSCLTNAV
jgi:hypothetical protein